MMTPYIALVVLTCLLGCQYQVTALKIVTQPSVEDDQPLNVSCILETDDVLDMRFRGMHMVDLDLFLLPAAGAAGGARGKMPITNLNVIYKDGADPSVELTQSDEGGDGDDGEHPDFEDGYWEFQLPSQDDFNDFLNLVTDNLTMSASRPKAKCDNDTGEYQCVFSKQGSITKTDTAKMVLQCFVSRDMDVEANHGGEHDDNHTEAHRDGHSHNDARNAFQLPVAAAVLATAWGAAAVASISNSIWN